jgi:hypothetical protein
MTPVDPKSSALAAIENQMRRMLNGETEPYASGLKIWETAMSSHTDSPDLMHPLWLIWGSLTDWVENRPEEQALAEAAMLRASREWLAIEASDESSKASYLDRWVYQEMGYERQINP